MPSEGRRMGTPGRKPRGMIRRRSHRPSRSKQRHTVPLAQRPGHPLSESPPPPHPGYQVLERNCAPEVAWPVSGSLPAPLLTQRRRGYGSCSNPKWGVGAPGSEPGLFLQVFSAPALLHVEANPRRGSRGRPRPAVGARAAEPTRDFAGGAAAAPAGELRAREAPRSWSEWLPGAHSAALRSLTASSPSPPSGQQRS